MARMVTEDVDLRVADLDAWPLTSAMEAMWEGQLAAVAAVGRAIPAITAATNAASQALGDRGRLIYVGAGTLGRIAVQDGADLMPTFAWAQERLGFIIVGGENCRERRRRGRRCRRCNQTGQCCTALAVRRGDRGLGQRYDPVYRGGAASGGRVPSHHHWRCQQSRRCATHISEISCAGRDGAEN
jgi:hypothetical protein